MKKLQAAKLERQLKTETVKRMTVEDELVDCRKEVDNRRRLEDVLEHYVHTLDEVFHVGTREMQGEMVERELYEKYFIHNPEVPDIATVLEICVDYSAKIEEVMNDFPFTERDMEDIRTMLPRKLSPTSSWLPNPLTESGTFLHRSITAEHELKSFQEYRYRILAPQRTNQRACKRV